MSAKEELAKVKEVLIQQLDPIMQANGSCKERSLSNE
jgi:hypothetical protein